MALDDTKGRRASQQFSTKKCPFCYTYLPLHAKRCTACKKRVGEVDKLGFAAKPFDWSGYVIAIASIIAFCIFMWWGFFRE
jgi:hypothetical protein